MSKGRRRARQLSLQYLDKNHQRRGIDKHHRPGRPVPAGQHPSERHEIRPTLRPAHPVHVTLRATREVGTLRLRGIYAAFRRAIVTTFRRTSFRIVHLSIQSTHVHLLVEADNRMCLARGLQGFQISAAKHINAALGKMRGVERRRGRVFADRYHAAIITSRRGVRTRLAYVLNNWRHHREDAKPFMRGLPVDPFSTAPTFTGWLTPLDFEWPSTYQPLPRWEPRTWLLRDGWKMYGRIDPAQIPGAPH